MANVASDLYGTNLWHLLDEMGGAKNFAIDLENDIVRGALVLKDGELMWPPPPPVEVEPEVKESHEGLDPDQLEKSGPVAAALEARKAEPGGSGARGVLLSLLALILAGGWVYLRASMGSESLSPETWIFLQHLTVFVLACFVGWQVIWNVTPALHTPLMSVTNAISGIIIVGGILQGHGEMFSAPLLIGAVATLFATINIVGGFYVTQRMLRMFRK
jgi:H+-translocating NAD(P) transhydrogenase subunit alpha